MFKKAFWVPYEDSANYPTLAKTMEAISKYCEENGKVSNHAFGNKLLLAELPDKDSVLVGRYLSGDGKHPPPCKLGVPLFLHRFGGVP